MHFFDKNNFILIFAQNLRTKLKQSSLSRRTSLKFSVKVVNKTAASDEHCTIASFQLRENKQKFQCVRINKNFIQLFNKLGITVLLVIN